MNERLLEAINKLNDRIKDIENNMATELRYIRDELKDTQDEFKDFQEKNDQLKINEVARRLEHYHIGDNENWFYDSFDTGKVARGPQGIPGKDFKYEDFTKEQLAKLVGPQGKQGVPGYTPVKGKDYFDGKDGKDGERGPEGKQGVPGKDAEAPTFKIGTIEESNNYGGGNAKLRRSKKDNLYYLDLVLPRGPQGFAGFDGKDGKDGEDAKINGYNEVRLVAGYGIYIKQKDNNIIISTADIPDNQLITSDNSILLTNDGANFIVKEDD